MSSSRHKAHRWIGWTVLGLLGASPLADLVATAPPRASLDAATLLHAVGSTSGAVAEGLLVVVVVLGLRSPLVERVLGPLDRLARVHHALGATAYALVLLHPLALASSVAMTRWSSSIELLFDARQPATVTGWAALLLLVVVVCAPLVRRLRHETWRHIHALAWLAAIGAIAHAAGMRSTRASDMALVTLLVAAAAERARVVLQETVRYRVIDTRSMGAGRVLDVELDPIGRPLTFRAGQYVFARFADPRTGWRCCEYHPFTIASGQAQRALRITIEDRGDCTHVLLGLSPGAEADLQGPFGDLLADAGRRPQVWLGGGVGIAPFLSAAESLEDDAPPIDLFYCGRREADLLHLEELTCLARRHPSLAVHPHVDERDGLPTADRVLSKARAGRAAEFFMAGPAGFTEALRRDLVARNVDPRRIHAERFDYL